MQHDEHDISQLTYNYPKFMETLGLAIIPSLKKIFRKMVVIIKSPVPVI